jgi:hypothetical protein
MISSKSYTKEWIESFRKQKDYKTVNPPLFEKMIHAFSLLEMLAGSGFDFIFKGGTSLLLMPVDSDRFSVDIDIITEKTKEELELSIEKSIGTSVFSSFHEDKGRTNSGGIPKAHYIFDFNPNYNKTGTILLDVLFEKNPYPTLTKTDIKCNWIDTTAPWLQVAIPSINAILGDKLTAFAPTTTGIPYWLNNPETPDKRLEIIKQLYDVSNLINHCNNTNETNIVFQTIATHQIKYRKLAITVTDVTDDIFRTALILAKREKNTTQPEMSYFDDLQKGIKMFEGHLIKTKFRIENAIVASAKTACFTQQLKIAKDIPFELFQQNSEVFKKDIVNTDFNFLNRFKKTNNQAYFYWYKCLELMNLLN